MDLDALDGRIGEGWGGVFPDGSHVNLVLARRGSGTAAALMTMFTSPREGHVPVLCCVGTTVDDLEAVWPPTFLMNKATATEERHQAMTWGATQLGVGQGVLDAVADGLIEGSDDLFVFVSVWIEPTADDETAVRIANRHAVRRAIEVAVRGRADRVPDLVARRDGLRHPRYGGD